MLGCLIISLFECMISVLVVFIKHNYVLGIGITTQALCRVPAALGKALNTLGKGFAECRTRQRPLGKKWLAKQPLSRATRPTLGKEI